ncbi:MAG: IS21 family transposase, partial [Chloroflexi bacterium]
EEREQVRRAYFIEKKSLRQIARELKMARKTVRKAIEQAEPTVYTLHTPRPALRLGPYRTRIDALLAEAEQMPRKQRYTGHKIFQLLQQEGYQGAESSVRAYIGRRRREQRRPQVFLPLEFDPGVDAQVDWGEAQVVLAGEAVTVQLFCMRLCYSRRLFMMAFPAQTQEAFFTGHVQAFHFFAGVPQRISYDNLKAAVQEVLQGHNRREQQTFVVFRSHYLFASHFCTPGQAHEKGGVEHGVGFGRRNFLVPIPQVADFAELNRLLITACQADDARQVDGQTMTIGAAWAQEQPHLRPLPTQDVHCCVTKAVTLTPYSQVEFETNRYSVPADRAQRHLVLRAYPFQVEILDQETVLATHPRSYGRQLEIVDPLHYLPLLEQRPGAFEHARPMRHWRTQWPPIYEQLLAKLQMADEGQGVREFVRVLKLHRHYPAAQVEAAIAQALAYGCIHADGVELCLRQQQQAQITPPALDLAAHPHLLPLAQSAPDLQLYNQLLGVQ